MNRKLSLLQALAAASLEEELALKVRNKVWQGLHPNLTHLKERAYNRLVVAYLHANVLRLEWRYAHKEA